MISIAICDDEDYMLNELQQKISTYMDTNELLYSIQLFNSSESLLYKKSHFDIIFLDIQMDRVNGMEAAKQIRKKDEKCFIIFITVLKEMVFEAFEVGASNYLIKPLADDKLSRTLDRIIKQLSDAECQYIIIHKGQAYWQIKISDIYYCEVIKRKIYIHLKNEIMDYYDSIESLEKTLPTNFFRCHRSYLINLNYVKGYENSNAILANGSSIPVSRLRQQDFSQAILKYMKNRGK
ncbi:two component transcriptional regulator, LytTR family [Anaerovirgula multivorans]|uniref:Stage 0 sporulation protein A homolog n=1 Tax=Anaerovirgula multivorans TaxID=312168 RepID=A0A239IG16_9FIRM|nr:LytTR family DNA-binding domain-containing protein [Anaerovirgula multivorans]SNS92537.1 two component transcriptional regulator, LytTR family [Anaerovirgula multivorans]